MDQDEEIIVVPINNDLERRIADAFEVFDHAGNKTVDVREVGTIVRSLGCCPSEAEVQEMLVAMEDPATPGNVHLIKFLPYVSQLITEHKYQPASPEQLLDAFHALDTEGRGYLTKEQITTLMTQDGEPFTQDELDEMLEIAIDPHTQTVPYEYYINQLMVLIAAAVCTKAGKTVVSRQFIEMTKARIEGLLAAFPKLIPAGTQHTFVETDSVRYVYQPMERLYMLLITTRASNILEDLETLRLFARVIPEYCRSLEESEIAENAFNLIFAFDEIVALGYRESVNLSQIRTFVEMDSHEEKVYQAVRQTQEREAKNKMREKAKELQRQKMELAKKGGKSSFGGSGGFGNSTGYTPVPTVGDIANTNNDVKPPPSYTVSKPTPASNRAMKLGGKSRDVESFVDQLKSEGENVVAPVANNMAQTGHKAPAIKQDVDGVHLRLEEKMVVKMGRDGGVQLFELLGLITLHIGNEKWGRIRVQLENQDTRGVQLQTHPNVDKELFKIKSQIGLKHPAKPFPLNTDVGVLKWRLQSTDENLVPLLINCWPSEAGDDSCDVNIEYELTHPDLELSDVNIYIPLPIGCNPIVSECDGHYTHEARRNQLIWSLPIIDSTNKTGSLEFSAPKSIPNDFFPLTLNFTSKSSFAKIKITDVLFVDDDSPVKHVVENVLFPDKYEIV